MKESREYFDTDQKSKTDLLMKFENQQKKKRKNLNMAM